MELFRGRWSRLAQVVEVIIAQLLRWKTHQYCVERRIGWPNLAAPDVVLSEAFPEELLPIHRRALCS